MRSRSLATRLIVSAGAVSAVLLLAAGLLLNYLFTAAVERNFDARLQAVLDSLLANVETSTTGQLTLQGAIADSRFDLPLSGWYWQVVPIADGDRRSLFSDSLLEQRFAIDNIGDAGRDVSNVAHFYLTDKNGTRLRAIEQRYTLFGGAHPVSFLVTGNFDELRAEIATFNGVLFAVLGLLGAGLLGAILVQVIFGLRPLRQLEREVAAVRQGSKQRLEETYPREIAPVANELNMLLLANTEIVERARTQVGNLAHALKTPLSVLTNEAGSSKSELAGKVIEQLRIMGDQISLYLDRARRAARAQSLGAATPVKPVCESIGRTVERIHCDKNLRVSIEVPDLLVFRGERQDLEEMVGNLIDNAAKWASGRVLVRAGRVSDALDGERPMLRIHVGDDGPGLAVDKRTEAVQRGRRLDETTPGSGLGLSIVSETAVMYQGKLDLDRSELGGLESILTLPAAVRGH